MLTAFDAVLHWFGLADELMYKKISFGRIRSHKSKLWHTNNKDRGTDAEMSVKKQWNKRETALTTSLYQYKVICHELCSAAYFLFIAQFLFCLVLRNFSSFLHWLIASGYAFRKTKKSTCSYRTNVIKKNTLQTMIQTLEIYVDKLNGEFLHNAKKNPEKMVFIGVFVPPNII